MWFGLPDSSNADAEKETHMKAIAIAAVLALFTGFAYYATPAELTVRDPGPNPQIDMNGYLKVSQDAANHRQKRRVTEEDFIKMSKEPGTIILDARSKAMYDLLHIKGAVHLNFSDIAVDTLKEMIPDKNTRILIYCNNNFPRQPAFITKMPTASLNLSTYIALYNYGYHNVYELGPTVDPKTSKLVLESTPKRK
jgi:3-mercaptopyruvate sulfurtransferase SseA